MSPGKDTEGRPLLGSLLTKLTLGSALKAASGKAVSPGAVAGGNPGVFSLTTSPWPFAFPCRHLPPPSAKEAAKQSRSTGVGRSDFNSNTRSATHLPCNPGQATFVSLSFLTWRMAIIPSEGGQEDARRRKVC